MSSHRNLTYPLTISAALLMLVAGVIHLVVAPVHYAHAPAHGVFFAVAGVVQVILGLIIWRRPSSHVYSIGAVVAGGLVVLWGITRLYQAPFSGEPEAVERWGLICKLTEGVAMMALLLLVFQEMVRWGGTTVAWRFTSVLVIAILAAGFVTYGVARAIEPALPWLAEQPHAEHADEGHDGDATHEVPADEHTDEHTE
jgi:hypothetical protein